MHEDDRALAQSCQQGNLNACRQLVERYQTELLRTAFLLTDDPIRSERLTTSAFLDFFHQLRREDADRDLRLWLLTCLIARFLELEETPEQPTPPTLTLVQGNAQRYSVENERTRTRQALARIDGVDRAVVVLSDFNNLPISDVSTTTGVSDGEVHLKLGNIRRRLENALDLDEDQPLTIMLTSATFDTLRLDLWEGIEEPLTEDLQRDRQRSKIVNVSVLAAVGLILVLLSVFLFDDAFRGGDQTQATPTTETLSASDINNRPGSKPGSSPRKRRLHPPPRHSWHPGR